MKINSNFLKLENDYLFSAVNKKASDFAKSNPDKKILKLSIGDVTLPLCDSVVNAIKYAADEMGNKDTFRGYGPEQGYLFLREKISDYYKRRNIRIDTSEIFVSDGAKCDLGNISDILSEECTVLIPDPVYPAYVDVNVMAGRKIFTIDGNQENGFKPLPSKDCRGDIIYICSPNNPTGAVYNKEELTQWVKFALNNNSLIIFDAAYEAFVSDENLPRSIYEIDGARECAIEICSLSKTAGFTGARCGYVVVPLELKYDGVSMNALWNRRQSTKFNGVSYITQKAAEAVFSEQGLAEIKHNLEYYKQNARVIREGLNKAGIWHTGGINSPYIWLKCPMGMKSWEFFDYLLENACVVGTPGAGFGKNGEGFFRLTSFGDRDNTVEAVNRFVSCIK